jgi:hypothetical protein
MLMKTDMKRTGTGFLRKTMKLSALCIMNRVNLLHNIRSISSACLTLMLNLIELTDGSIKTRSFSFREMIRGFRRTSLDVLKQMNEVACTSSRVHVRAFNFWLVMSLYDLINGLLIYFNITQRKNYLRSEILQGKCSCQCRSYCSKIWSENVRLRNVLAKWIDADYYAHHGGYLIIYCAFAVELATSRDLRITRSLEYRHFPATRKLLAYFTDAFNSELGKCQLF